MKLTSSSPSSHFPIHQTNDHDQYHHHPFDPNRSSSVSCHFFFDSTQDHHSGFYDHHQLYRPNHHVTDGESYGSTYEIKNRGDSGLNFSVWKKDDGEHQSIKWMSSKMRLMQKMKTTDDDQKVQASSSSDLSSNSSSYNNSPIRVCSDCSTTKTPLWRSGPKGPKSLCNACGIRQRKARRAMAAAIAASANTAADQPATTTTKIKLQHKGKMSAENGLASHLKKRCKTTASTASAAVSPSNENKKLGFEDFLINLSKNLAFHRVFPDDEKDAAILLMALSSGLVNG